MQIAVVGAGSWGTALAKRLCLQHPTLLYGRNPAAMAQMRQSRCNDRYLPGCALPSALQFSAELKAVKAHIQHAFDDPEQSALIVLAVPVQAFRETLEQLIQVLDFNTQHRWPNNLGLIWVCKGFEAETQALPHQIVDTLWAARGLQMADITAMPYGVLSGPSFAREVADDQPCALTLASPHAGLRALGMQAFHGAKLRIYTSEDMLGVEIAAAVKNVIAIACGVSDGLGLGLNARAALITRGLAEISRLGMALGARADTFVGLSGLGDLVLTATGDLSRNRRVGLALAEGKTLDLILQELGQVAEGVRCACATAALAAEHDVEMPITQAVCAMLFEGLSPVQAVDLLTARDPRPEGIFAFAS